MPSESVKDHQEGVKGGDCRTGPWGGSASEGGAARCLLRESGRERETKIKGADEEIDR
jgi:hypothetical protein